jgi:thymidine kinase
MPDLHIVLGPMFAGKSTYLINTIENLKKSNDIEDILIINHGSDKRYSNDSVICTHDNVKMPSLSLNKLEDIFNIIDNDIFNKKKYIFIDEGQFFNDLYNTVKTLLLHHNKTIYISGLDGDYKQIPFYDSRILDLIPLATTITKLTSICFECKGIAPFTKRIINSGEQILVGGSDSYKPVCLNHL